LYDKIIGGAPVIRSVLLVKHTIQEAICGQRDLGSPVPVSYFALKRDNDMRQAIVVLVITFLALPLPAGEPTVRAEDNEVVRQLRQQIASLERRVAELESQLAPPHASGQTSDMTLVPWYRQHRFVPASAPVLRIHSLLNPSTKGCVEEGMRAGEIEHRRRMENYLNNPGLEPLDPTRHQWPLRSFR